MPLIYKYMENIQNNKFGDGGYKLGTEILLFSMLETRWILKMAKNERYRIFGSVLSGEKRKQM